MKPRATLYGLIGVIANIGGLVSAGVVLVVSSFQGVGGQALTVRVGLAFLVVTAISLTATIWNRRFSPTAGSDISGHQA